MSIGSALCKSSDAEENFIGGFCPNKWLGFGVIGINELVDSAFQFGDASMAAATNLFHCQLCKPAFDQIHPRTIGRGEVQMEPRAFGQPPVNERGFGKNGTQTTRLRQANYGND